MLSRVAESLYWSARYVERAEDVARLLDVDFHALLDGEVADRGGAWQQLVAMLGDREAYLEHFDEYTAESVGSWLLVHPGNANSVAGCIQQARENTRSVREQISAEMWEAINRAFLFVRGAPLRQPEPHAVFQQVRTFAHLFQGTADATMEHGESYEFIRLGLHLERAEKTTRILGTRYAAVAALDENDPARPRALRDLLRSCGAFESFVRRHGTELEPLPVAEELVRSPDSPRSVLHCLTNCLNAATQIRSDNGVAHRILGRLCADVEFGEPPDTSGRGVAEAMGTLLAGIGAAGEAITKAYFSSRSVPVAAIEAQEVQQQQCG